MRIREVVTVEDDVEGNLRIITAAFKLKIILLHQEKSFLSRYVPTILWKVFPLSFLYEESNDDVTTDF